MNVLITGGSGFIGRALCARLAAGGHRLIVLSRRPAKARPLLPADTRVVASLDEIDDDEALDGIVNLAGENLFSGRWTAPRKDRLLASRVETTAAVIALARRLRRTPEVLVSGSAVGFYGDAGDAELTEYSSARRKDFGYRLCDAWEQRARDALSLGMRLCVIRTGIVLGRDGGMLAKLWPVYRLGLGARLGKGSQWLSWIHIEDMVTILERALETPGVDGVFNATAPKPGDPARFPPRPGGGRPSSRPLGGPGAAAQADARRAVGHAAGRPAGLSPPSGGPGVRVPLSPPGGRARRPGRLNAGHRARAS